MRSLRLRCPTAIRRAASLIGLSLLALAGDGRRAGGQVTADSTMFAVNNTTTIYTVNRLTGAVTPVGTLLFASVAIARDPATGRVYYTSSNTAGSPTGRVAYWDPATGTNTLLNAAGSPLQNPGALVDDALAFTSGGVLYSLSGGVSTLYSINPATGAYTNLGNVRVGAAGGPSLTSTNDLAFDNNGIAYLIGRDAGAGAVTNAYTLSLVKAGGVYVATLVSALTATPLEAIAVGADGRLYAGGRNGNIWAGSVATGAAQIVAGGPLAYSDFASSPRFADLSITGTSPGLPVGGVADYTITVSNAGPQSANGQITVVDSLPAGLTYQSVTGAGWSCAAVGQRVTCTNPGPLANGSASTLVISSAVAVGTAGSPTNILLVVGSTIDADQTDNRFTFTTATTSAVFAPTKTHAGNFTVGQNGVYTISATNSGTWATISTLTLTDTMPAGMTFVSGTGTNWTCVAAGVAPEVVTCTRPNATPIAINGSTSITLTVSVGALAAPSKTNKVYLAGGGQLAVSTASDPTTVTPLTVGVTPDGATVSQLPSNATTSTQTFTILNSGAVSTTYTLTASKSPGTSLAITSVNGVAGVTTTRTIPAGTSVPVNVVYTVVPGAVAGAVDTLILRATSNVNALMTDRGWLVVTVVRAGLTISKLLYRDDMVTLVGAAANVSPGEYVQFKVSVTGTGAAGSTLVHITDAVPAAVAYVSNTPDAAGWTITQAAGVVQADLTGALATGQTRFFWIRGRVQ
jgi:uncharacterized repeat protein (TIGR01451 family)